ncbi:hypothetical protein AVEN_59389-1 [Araneus ventricosus]|uniref:Uncharacterized protein n=1 Tax=Araneus ventricosus TaxID=182803 RepID=A0A4Y2LHP0_ARAVE|nr:hypothetical protein AVEN_59389-1 [Araneus ventricosus]
MNTHVGHSQEFKFVRLPPTSKVQIASDIKDGINPEKILENVRKKIDDEHNRGHLLTREDINNIQVSFGLKGIERHSDDATSVHLMHKEYEELEENPFLICKL